MKALKRFFLISFILVLSSCASTTPAVVTTEPVHIARVPKPTPIEVEDVTWKVITVDNEIYYGLSIHSYQNLANNMLDIKRYLEEEKAIITYYEKVMP